MAIPLKLSTAGQVIPLGQFLDSVNGNDEEGGLTIANTDIKIWKAGATTLANKNSGGATYISNGVYYCTLDATDTNTLGPLVVFIHVAGALAVKVECIVQHANVYEALVAGTEFLETVGGRQTFDTTGGTLTVKKRDGTTTQFTKTLGTNGAALPIVSAS
jgi:hypothetical protein